MLSHSLTADPENGAVLLAEDDDVARERELLHSKPIPVLQMDNNLVIKYEDISLSVGSVN